MKIAKCIVGACIISCCAAPLLAEEGKPAGAVQLAKLVAPEDPLRPPAKEAPRVRVKETVDYYDITGRSADDLRRQMKSNGTTWNDGKVYAALTTWDIRYHYDIKDAGGRYHLAAISTEVDVTIHLPRLATSANTPQQLASSWGSYLEHLKTHEYGHRDIAVRMGQEIQEQLAALGSSTSRGDLDDAAQRLLAAEFQKLKQEQIDYDAETHHGIKQGAVLHDPEFARSEASAK